MIFKKTALLAVVISFLVSCSGFAITADVGFAQFSPSGDLGLGPSSGVVDPKSVKNDIETSLGIDDSLGTPYVRLEFSAAVASFTFSAFSIGDSANGILAADYGDIPVGSSVNTDMDLTSLKAAVHFDLFNLGPIRISPGLGVNLLAVDIESRSTIATINEQVDESVPIPMVFLQAEVDLGVIDAVVDLGYLDVDVGNVRGSMIDVEAIARWRPISHFEAFVGYRLILLEADGDSDGQNFLFDLALNGWIIGVGIHF